MMLHPKDRQTLKEVLGWYRQNKAKLKPGKPRKMPRMLTSGLQLKIGKTDGIISSDASGTVSVWRDGSDTGEDITAWLDWMTDQNISADKEVLCAYFNDESKWRIVGAECEDAAPDIFMAINQDEPQTLTTTYAEPAGMKLDYTSGTAITPSIP
jgi:hypothetical protein